LKTIARIAFAAAVTVLVVAPLFATGVLEEIKPANFPTGARIITSGAMLLTGGVIDPSAMSPYLTGKTYFTNQGCTASNGCQNTISMTFAKPVSDLKFTIASHPYDNTYFFISDDRGHLALVKFGCVYYCDRAQLFTNPATISWPYPGVQAVVITASNDGYYPAYFWYYGIGYISYTVAPDYGIVARLGTDPDAPNEPDPVLISAASTAHIPLGRQFSIRLKRKHQDGTWQDEPASFALKAGTIQGGPVRSDQSLFITSPLFLYNTPPDQATRLLQSVHLGSAPLLMTPNDTTLPAVTLNLTSVDPATLGAATPGNNTSFDNRLKAQAHNRGIPPQYLKAIAAHESGNTFDRHTWRYEPNADRLYIAPFRGAPPYSDFVLPAPTTDAAGFSLGRWLCPLGVNGGCGFPDIDDLAPKGSLSFTRAGATTPIPPYDVNAYVTIREICNGNPKQNWPCPVTSTTTSTPTSGPHRAVASDPWAIVANPHMASSYGIMQSTWYSVIEGHVWDGSTPAGLNELRRNPALLFDDENNIARGSASVVVGANELRYDFNLANGYTTPLNPNFDTPDDFAKQMREAVIRYNGAGYAAINYADSLVLPLVPLYLGVLPVNTKIISAQCAAPPAITATSSPTITPGASVTLEAIADRADHYQWYEGAVGDTTRPLGTDSSTIDVAPSATTPYWVSASNTCGLSSASTTVAVASDCTPPRAVATTADQSIVNGSSVALNVTATDAQAHQWFSLTDDGTLNAVQGATSASVAVRPTQSTTYFDVISNSCEAIRSPFIRVTVTYCAPPAIVMQPPSPSVLSGGTARLEVIASGSDPLVYQWYVGASDVTSAPIAGAAGRTVDVTPTAGTSYWVRVSNACGTVDSAAATVSIDAVCQPITITNSPAPATVASGEPATLAVAVSGTSPASYQWYLGASGNTSSPIAGATDRTLSVVSSVTQQYWARATNPCGSADSSAAVITVTACDPPHITSATPSQQVTTGGTVSLAVTATGSAPLVYQWYLGPSGDASHPITGATAANYPVAVTATTTYWARVSNSCGVAETASITFTATNCFPPTISQQPVGASISIGQQFTLSVAASGPGPLSYQWFEGAPGDTSHPIAGATTASVSVTPQATTLYWVRVSGSCGTTSSFAVTVSVTGVCLPPTILAQVQSTDITIGDFAEFLVAASGTDPLAYQWYVGTTGDTSAPIQGATTSILRISPPTTTSYWVRISNSCGTAASVTGTVTVFPCDAVEITSQPASITITRGDQGYLSVDASGTDPKTARWYVGVSGDESQPTNLTAFTIPVSPTETTSYWALVSNACGTAVSAAATVVVLPACSPAAITASPSSTQITSGASASLSVAATGTGPLSYQWFAGQAGDESSPISGATSSTLAVTPQSTTDYWVEVTNSCGIAVSSTTTVTVVPVCSSPQITAGPLSQSISQGSSIQLFVEATGTAPIAYNWFSGTAPDTSQPVGSGPSVTVSPNATTSYWVRLSNSCGTVDSDAATVNVALSCVSPTVAAASSSVTITAGDSVSLTATASGTAPFAFTWYLGTPSDTSQPLGSGASITVSPTASSSYWVRATNSCGGADSAAISITVNQPCDLPAISSQPQSPTIVTGGSVTLSVIALGTAPLAYQWYEAGAPLPGATDASITVTPLDTTNYFVRITNACGYTDSDVATITVVPSCGGCGSGPGGGPQQNASTALAAPTHLTAVAKKQAVIDLAWRNVSPVNGPVFYQLWRSEGTGPFKPVATTSAVSYHDRALLKGHIYRYFALATDTSGARTSAPSNIATATAY
jgi:hypothetical protein